MGELAYWLCHRCSIRRDMLMFNKTSWAKKHFIHGILSYWSKYNLQLVDSFETNKKECWEYMNTPDEPLDRNPARNFVPPLDKANGVGPPPKGGGPPVPEP